jgi:hypothetical protein
MLTHERFSPRLIAGEMLWRRKSVGGFTSSAFVESRFATSAIPLSVEPWSCIAFPLVRLFPTVIEPLNPAASIVLPPCGLYDGLDERLERVPVERER